MFIAVERMYGRAALEKLICMLAPNEETELFGKAERLASECLKNYQNQGATELSKRIAQLDLMDQELDKVADRTLLQAALAAARSSVKDARAKAEKAKALNRIVDEAGIDRNKLDLCKEIDGAHLRIEHVKKDMPEPKNGDPKDFDLRLANYLTEHLDPNDPIRKKLEGYLGPSIGDKPKEQIRNEITRNIQIACWNYSVFGGAFSHGPNRVKSEEHISPENFYALFNSSCCTKEGVADILFNTTGQRPIPRDVDEMYTLLKSVDGRLEHTPFLTLTKAEKTLLLQWKPEIQNLLDKFYAALEEGREDWYDIQKEGLELFLKVNGLEIAGEDETTAFAIAMHPDYKTGLDWTHWGLEIRTSNGVHMFDTIPGCAIAHNKKTFEEVWGKESYHVLTVPIKKLTPQHVALINESLNHFIL